MNKLAETEREMRPLYVGDILGEILSIADRLQDIAQHLSEVAIRDVGTPTQQ